MSSHCHPSSSGAFSGVSIMSSISGMVGGCWVLFIVWFGGEGRKNEFMLEVFYEEWTEFNRMNRVSWGWCFCIGVLCLGCG